MSTRTIVHCVIQVRCDKCGAPGPEVEACDGRYPRYDAERIGWAVRPNGGIGSQSAPDLCPDCKPAPSEPVPATRRPGAGQLYALQTAVRYGHNRGWIGRGCPSKVSLFRNGWIDLNGTITEAGEAVAAAWQVEPGTYKVVPAVTS